MKSIEEFINKLNKNIKCETLNINILNKKINEYEAIIDVIQYNEYSTNTIRQYREKINQCYLKIESSFENINYNRNLLATMKKIDKIIKRGEKSA